MAGVCKTGAYKTNYVVSHSPLACFGGLGVPRCEHLARCLRDNEQCFTPRGFRIMMKRLEEAKDR